MATAQLNSAGNSLSSQVISWTLMLPLLCFALHGVLQFGSHSQNNLDANLSQLAAYELTPLERAEGPAILAFTFILAIKTFASSSKLVMANKWLVGLSLLALISVAWSQFPSVTFQGSIYQVMNVWFVFYLAARFTKGQQVALFQILGWMVVVSSIILALFFPAYGIDHTPGKLSGTWIGIFNHKNYCAIVTTFLLSASLHLRSSHPLFKPTRFIFVILSLFLILMSQSHTGWVVAFTLIVYEISVKCVRRFERRDQVCLVMCCVFVMITVSVLVIYNYSDVMVLFGKDPSLTGRTDIWKAAFLSAVKKPMLGYGYQAFWHNMQGESANIALINGFVPPHAHNGYIEVWLELGLVGLLLVVGSIYQALRNGLTCFKYGWSGDAEWYLGIIVMTIVTNVAEISFVASNYLVWLMYVLACVGLNNEASRIRSRTFA
jgi:exopolysaccharide production protein ExoQ